MLGKIILAVGIVFILVSGYFLMIPYFVEEPDCIVKGSMQDKFIQAGDYRLKTFILNKGGKLGPYFTDKNYC